MDTRYDCTDCTEARLDALSATMDRYVWDGMDQAHMYAEDEVDLLAMEEDRFKPAGAGDGMLAGVLAAYQDTIERERNARKRAESIAVLSWVGAWILVVGVGACYGFWATVTLLLTR